MSTIWGNLNLNTHHASSLRLGFDVANILLGKELVFSKNKTVID